MANENAQRFRVGVMFGPVDDLNVVAAGYLILHLNTLQRAIEFELVPAPTDSSLWSLLSEQVVSRKRVEAAAAGFKEQYSRYWQDLLARSIASEEEPERLVIISLAKFEDNLYSTTLQNLGITILALGNWERHMAPPSIVEFITVLVIRSAIGLIDPQLRQWQHLGTRGCLWDYNPYLRDARYKVLVGYTCDECLKRIREGPVASLAEDLGVIMSKSWLWKKDDPQSPSAIAAKLGYDLFSTKVLGEIGANRCWTSSAKKVSRSF